MEILLNLVIFIGSFIISYKCLSKWLGKKELTFYSVNITLAGFLYYLCAKYLNIGIVVFGNQRPIAQPENIIRMWPSFLGFMLFMTIACFIFEWWYHKYFLPKKGVSSSEELKQKSKNGQTDIT